jgi:phosphoribosylformylglycinamidine cyclo-ligase
VTKLTYAASGVATAKADALVEEYKAIAAATNQAGVVAGVGGFSGFFALPPGYQEPVLTAATDGVGTKLRLLLDYNLPRWAGRDAAAMCLNDLATSGAKPLFMLDYLAMGKLETETAREVVAGFADYCREADCVLLGGETAEMPGFYPPGDLDIAGFALGVVERRQIIDGSRCQAGDLVIGLASSGLHSNGYSLIRLLVREGLLDLNKDYPGLEGPLWQQLLEPTRLYTRQAAALCAALSPGAFAHITGGGLLGNAARTLPSHLDMLLDQPWPQSPLYQLLIQSGVSKEELFATFNMGIGFTVIMSPGEAQLAIKLVEDFGQQAWLIGRLIPGTGQVRLDV